MKRIKRWGRVAYSETDMTASMWSLDSGFQEYEASKIIWRFYWLSPRF